MDAPRRIALAGLALAATGYFTFAGAESETTKIGDGEVERSPADPVPSGDPVEETSASAPVRAAAQTSNADVGHELGLDASERARFEGLLKRLQERRAALAAELGAGRRTRAEISADLTTSRDEVLAEVRSLLGEARYARYEAIARR